MRKYFCEKAIDSGVRIFPITCAAARLVVKKAENMLDLNMRPYEPCRRSGSFPAGSVRFRSGMKDVYCVWSGHISPGLYPGLICSGLSGLTILRHLIYANVYLSSHIKSITASVFISITCAISVSTNDAQASAIMSLRMRIAVFFYLFRLVSRQPHPPGKGQNLCAVFQMQPVHYFRHMIFNRALA